MAADIGFEDERLVLSAPRAIHVQGKLEVPGAAEVMDLKAVQLGADRVFITGEQLAGLPTLPPLPTPPSPAPSKAGPAIKRPDVTLDKAVTIDPIAEHNAFVKNGQLDVVAYIRYLHRHIAWLHQQLAAKNP